MKTIDKSIATDELLMQVPEADIVAGLKHVLERVGRWFELKGRTIPATDIKCYIGAFEEILMLERLPDIPPSSSVN